MSLVAPDFHFVIIYFFICFGGIVDGEKQVVLVCVLVMVTPLRRRPEKGFLGSEGGAGLDGDHHSHGTEHCYGVQSGSEVPLCHSSVLSLL